jgi:hypothetical protein
MLVSLFFWAFFFVVATASSITNGDPNHRSEGAGGGEVHHHQQHLLVSSPAPNYLFFPAIATGGSQTKQLLFRLETSAFPTIMKSNSTPVANAPRWKEDKKEQMTVVVVVEEDGVERNTTTKLKETASSTSLRQGDQRQGVQAKVNNNNCGGVFYWPLSSS